jgi:GNAT superfamily N-acetyltransferase
MTHVTAVDSIRVRPALREDVSLMARWAEAMALETEDKPLDPDTVARGIQLALDDPERGRYFIAEIGGEPAGTLMLTTEWSDWRCGWWWWIQSVYVETQFRRRGVYRALHGYVFTLAQADPEVRGLRLYVERDNSNACRTYEFLGMHDSGYRMYELSISHD